MAADDGTMFYFQRSRKFPQQTTLLGMLRYQLLLQNNLLAGDPETITAKDTAEKLIGKNSFDESDQTFGAIQAIGPAFLEGKQQQSLFPMRWVGKEQKKTVDYIPPQFDNTTPVASFSSALGVVEASGQLAHYKSKIELETRYIAKVSGDNEGISEETIWTDLPGQIGIRKPQKWRDEKDNKREGFFKMHYQYLQKGFAFAFHATLDKGAVLRNNLVFMGKERSMFRMEVKPIGSPTRLTNPAPDYLIYPLLSTICPKRELQAPAIWLLSDACVAPAVYKHCRLVVADTVNFRNIRATLETPNYFAKPKKELGKTDHPGHLQRREHRRELLQRGSLLFPQEGKLEDLEKCFKNPAFQKIGYNQYTILR